MTPQGGFPDHPFWYLTCQTAIAETSFSWIGRVPWRTFPSFSEFFSYFDRGASPSRGHYMTESWALAVLPTCHIFKALCGLPPLCLLVFWELVASFLSLTSTKLMQAVRIHNVSKLILSLSVFFCNLFPSIWYSSLSSVEFLPCRLMGVRRESDLNSWPIRSFVGRHSCLYRQNVSIYGTVVLALAMIVWWLTCHSGDSALLNIWNCTHAPLLGSMDLHTLLRCGSMTYTWSARELICGHSPFKFASVTNKTHVDPPSFTPFRGFQCHFVLDSAEAGS